MPTTFDDFLESELETSWPQGATIEKIIEAITYKRVYDALERLRENGKVERERERLSGKYAYKIPPIVIERRF